MTALQQLLQLSVSIAFNFLGNWVGRPQGRQTGGQKGSGEGQRESGREWFKPERVIFSQVRGQIWHGGTVVLGTRLTQTFLPVVKLAPISRSYFTVLTPALISIF